MDDEVIERIEGETKEARLWLQKMDGEIKALSAQRCALEARLIALCEMIEDAEQH